jgi:Ca2+-binding RTX toxin-like protein
MTTLRMWKSKTVCHRRPRLLRTTVLAIVGAAILALAAAGTTASGEGQIVVHGADSGSHLRLTVNGNVIVVNGYMTPDAPTGCHFTDPRRTAVCPLSGVAAIEVDMGPSDDKVEVLDALPIPLTTYLGQGSDKLIANGEPDTCYPQGTRRNRCIGGAGDDICITGPRNSDCVGGPGNDYCQHSTGSDGCWGGTGNDVCYMGPGKDGCHGGPGNDRLYEGSGSGKLYGGRGADRLYGGGSADKLYGGPGRDYCNGQGQIGRSYKCETGPGH